MTRRLTGGWETLRLFLRLVAYRPWLYAANLLLAAIGFVVVVVLPGFAVQATFDSLAGPDPGLVWWVVAWFCGLQLFYAAIWLAELIIDRLFLNDATTLIGRNLLLTAFGKPGALPPSVSPGDAVTRYRDDTDHISRFLSINGGILYALVEPLFAVGLIVLMLRINVVLTLVGLLPLAVMLIATQLFTARLQQNRRASLEANGQVTNAIGEVFGAVQAVQAASAEGDAARHLRRLNEARRPLLVRETLLQTALYAVHTNSTQISTGLILLFGGQAIRDGTFSVGDFASFTYFLGFIANLLLDVGRGLASFQQTRVSFDRLGSYVAPAPVTSTVAHAPSLLRGPLPAVPPIQPPPAFEQLTVRGLAFHYPGSDRGISGVDFDIAAGELVVITGRIGAGKTTLLRALLGLLPGEGEMRWNGELVDDPAAFFVPPRTAYTAQAPRLFSESLADSILLGLPPDRLEAAIHAAALDPDLALFPDGTATLVGPRGVRLSGGQVQRVAAARMFVRDCALYVVDDLSSALDFETEARLWDRLRGHACLAVSHRHTALERADRILVLRAGTVDSFAPLDQALRESSELRAIWETGR